MTTGGAGGRDRAAAPAPVAIILAGGQARRMGGLQKALIEVDGRAILDRQLEVLGPRFGRIAAVLERSAAGAAGPGQGAAATGDDDAFRARNLAVVRDQVAGRGPLAGIAAGLAWAGGATVLALACDMPFVSGAVIDLLLSCSRAERADLVLPVVDGRPEPLLACYSARTLPIIERELAAGRLRAGAVADAVAGSGLGVVRIDGDRIRTVDPELRSLVNINRLPRADDPNPI